MGNKLFVIGGHKTTSCEIFDSFSRYFTMLKSSIEILAPGKLYFNDVCFDQNIVMIQNFQDNLTKQIV